MSFGRGAPPATDLSMGTDMSLGAGMPLAAGMPVGTGASTGAVNTAVGAAESAYGGKAAKALAFAREQYLKPCVWGATGPDSYDSASLVQAAWRAAGSHFRGMFTVRPSAGAAIPLTDIQFGDLIFFYDNVSHVGFYTGNGMIIDAPSPGASIREELLRRTQGDSQRAAPGVTDAATSPAPQNTHKALEGSKFRRRDLRDPRGPRRPTGHPR